MKTQIIIIGLLVCINLKVSFAQQVVVDPTVVGTLVANHTVQNGTLNDIESEQSQIRALQATISLKLAQIKELRDKTYESLSNVKAVVRDGKNVIYASKIAVDIGKYQKLMVDNANGNATLYAIALKTEVELINRTYDLFSYINNALKGGEGNLMTNMDRMKIINHVVEELRVMRGLAYSVNRKIRTAKYAGSFRALLREYDISLLGIDRINRRGIIDDVLPKR